MCVEIFVGHFWVGARCRCFVRDLGYEIGYLDYEKWRGEERIYVVVATIFRVKFDQCNKVKEETIIVGKWRITIII